jgi:hypothetical protein
MTPNKNIRNQWLDDTQCLSNHIPYNEMHFRRPFWSEISLSFGQGKL